MIDFVQHALAFARPVEQASSVDPPAALLDGCRRGDRDALDKVFRTYAPQIERLLVRLVGPGVDVQDLMQDTFTAAIVAFPGFRGEAAIGTWLHSIAVRIVFNHFRRKRYRGTVPLVDAIDEATQAADDAIAQHDATAKLYQQLAKLDAKKRIAFVLHVGDNLSIAEVSALMGASRAATTSRIFWAKRMLVRRLRHDPVFADRRGTR